MNKKKFTYKKSGVNIKAADKFVDFISTVSAKKEAKKSSLILGGLVQLQMYQITLKNLRS